MAIDKNYFLDRLANGEDMDTIGKEIAAMMTDAINEHNANLEAEAKRKAETEKEQTKRELIQKIVEIVQELAVLEGMDPDEVTISDEDLDQMVAAFTEMFAAMRDLKKMLAGFEDHKPVEVTVKRPANAPTDEQILADFIKMFN